MADIRLRIEVNPDAETETLGTITNKVNDVGTNSNLSNVSFKASSSGEYADRTATNENGREMLSWANNGVLQFNSEGLLSTDGVVAGALASETDPDMFVWGAVPESKQYSVKLTFSKATSLKDIVVYGDKTANQFPTKAIIDGTKTIYSDDYQWAINMETESDTHTIEFVEWNRANYNACLTRIMVMLRYFDLDKGWIDSVESLTQSTSDPSSIQYGVLANSGSATIRDLDGELKDYVQDGIIPSQNIEVKIIANNNQTQNHITLDTLYNPNKKMLSLELTNTLNKWNEIYFNGYITRDRKGFKEKYGIDEYYTLYEILCYIFSDCLAYDSATVDLMLSTEIKTYLQNIQLDTFYMEVGNLLQAINKICEIAQLSVSEDNFGNVKFYTARPIITKPQKQSAIEVKKYLQLTELESDIIYKNKYNGIKTQTTIYNRNNRILQPLENKTGDFETLQSFVINGSFWYSDYFQDENAITQNNDYIIEDFTIGDIVWKICYKKESLNHWTRVLQKIYPVASITETSNTRPMLMVFNETKFSMLTQLITYTDVEHFKSFLYNTSDNFRAGFLEYKYSPINPYIGQYVNEIQPIFAYKSTISFPMQIFYISSTVNSTTGKKTLVQENIEIKNANETVNNGKNTNLVELNTNELLSKNTKYNNTSIIKIIGDNIITDYSNGIATAIVDVFIGNLYNSQGQLVKNWQKGEILDVGDIVYFENDKNADSTQRYWRVTGRKFNYSGSPTLSLELQEVKVVE